MAIERDIQVETAAVGKVAVLTETHTVVRRLSPQDVQAEMDQLAAAIARKEEELADLRDRQDRLAAVADSLAVEADPAPVGKVEEPQGTN